MLLILFFFVNTRSSPPIRQPHQIGVQGGFLVVRPNQTDFQKLVDIILAGGGYQGAEWGGDQKLGYGGYYGAGTIQGLASYYYGHFEHNRSLELNRCYYNTMVDNPMGTDVHHRDEGLQRCRTLEETCQDCRETDVKDIFTTHFTVCGKPYRCPHPNGPLCVKLNREWHRVRSSLEKEWMRQFEGYNPAQRTSTDEEDQKDGHCENVGSYVPLKFPAEMNDASVKDFFYY